MIDKLELFFINLARIRRIADQDERERRADNLVRQFGLQEGMDRISMDCLRGLDIIEKGDDAYGLNESVSETYLKANINITVNINQNLVDCIPRSTNIGRGMERSER